MLILQMRILDYLVIENIEKKFKTFLLSSKLFKMRSYDKKHIKLQFCLHEIYFCLRGGGVLPEYLVESQ